MNYILIRTCIRDEWISRLCYHSFKASGIDGEYAFLAENGDYSLLPSAGIPIIYRHHCDNFGGQFGAKSLLMSLNQWASQKTLEDNDLIIVSDADIVIFHKSFLDHIGEAVHAGEGGVIITSKNQFLHLSGQMQILKYSFLRRLIAMSMQDIDGFVQQMINEGFGVADDSFIGYMSEHWGLPKKSLENSIHKYWHHHHYWSYNGRTDYQAVLDEIKSK